MSKRAERLPVEWGVATRCRRGEATNGDLAVVTLLPDGALVAAIDGLGHGREAARAAGTVGDVLRNTRSHDLVSLVERCHTALKGTRGAVISLAFLSSMRSTMTWLGVGNVEGRLVSGVPSVTRTKGSLAVASGLPGHELPKVSAATLDIRPGDIMLLATDGIAPGFAESLDVSGPPQAITDRILLNHSKTTDDALVVAVRYLGSRP
jgi:negative regulator of sigma-B (phosphoserine phosphatase)